MKKNKNYLVFEILLFSLMLITACNEDKKANVISYFIENNRQSDIYSVKVNDIQVQVSVVPDIDTAQAKIIAQQYKKLPSYCWIDSRFISVHYIHFAADSVSKIEIEVNEAIESYTIYPKRTGINAKLEGNSLIFTLNQNTSRHYLISINELPMFVLLAEDYEHDKPDMNAEDVIPLSQFYNASEQIPDYSSVFRKAIKKLNGTGKTLYIPAGEYITDAIEIADCHDFDIYFEPGSIIKTTVSPAGKNISNAGILINNSQNIRIYGRGYLDHQAYENFRDGINDYHHGFPGYDFYFKFEDIPKNSIYMQSPLLLLYSHNIIIEGLLIKNGRNYNINSRHCNDIIIRNVKVITPAGSIPENTDGINIGSYQNFLIENSFVYCNDDAFATGHNLLPYDNRSSENLKLINFIGWNPRANALRLAWASNTYIGDMLLKNCDFSGMDDSAILLHKHTSTGKEDKDSLCYATVRFENCTFDDVDIETRPMIDVQKACMKSLEFVNVTFDAVPKLKSTIYGDEEKKIGKLLLENVIIGGNRVTGENFDFDTKNIKEIIIR